MLNSKERLCFKFSQTFKLQDIIMNISFKNPIIFLSTTLKRFSQHLSILLIPFFALVLCGCQANSQLLEPIITYTPDQHLITSLPPAFPPLSQEESNQDWGKEVIIARIFARDFDLYRAITSYKRALILIPLEYSERHLEIEYGIILSYFLGKKYQEVIDTFESSSAKDIPSTFAAFDDLLVILYHSYLRIGQAAKACQILTLIEMRNPFKADHLALSEAISQAEFPEIERIVSKNRSYEDISTFMCQYHQEALSVKKAQTLNAILPGAGYYYVGQKKAGTTSFLINALFIAAAYQFFHRGDIAASIITASFEMGWYFGGINGAGLAAKEYNERLYESKAKAAMVRHSLFPVLMLETTF